MVIHFDIGWYELMGKPALEPLDKVGYSVQCDREVIKDKMPRCVAIKG